MKTATLSALLGVASADFYMHNPAGGNDRNRERNQNRNNGNRLFDSQNNGNGGYPWRGDATLRGSPDPMVYYEGSQLPTEWTLQVCCVVSFATGAPVLRAALLASWHRCSLCTTVLSREFTSPHHSPSSHAPFRRIAPSLATALVRPGPFDVLHGRPSVRLRGVRRERPSA